MGWARRGPRGPHRREVVVDTLVGLGFAAGALVLGVAVHRAWTGRWVPPWLPTAGALVVLVAARRSFLDVTPDTTPEAWAVRLDVAASAGRLYIALGAVSALAGAVGPRGARRSPALVVVGMLLVAAGIVWAAWTQGEAALWRAADSPGVIVEGVRADAEQRLRGAVAGALAVLAGMALPAAVWGFRAGRWAGVGESVAAGVLVAVVLNTGQPAREAVLAATAPWRTRCDAVDAAAVSRPPGDVPWDGRALVRVGPTGEEVFEGGAWRDAPWPDGPLAIVAPLDLPSEVLARWLDGRPDIVFAGWRATRDAPRLYDRHPALLASRCRASAWVRPSAWDDPSARPGRDTDPATEAP